MEYKLLNKQEYIKYLPEMQELFKICFGRDIDETYFLWRYIKNTSEDLLIYVALENGKIIANYSVFPCNLCIGEDVIKAGLSMTTMTHPDFNGRGIFVTLAEKLYDEMTSMGYDLVFGFPNNNSHRAFRNILKWNDIYEIPTMNLLVENMKLEIMDSEYKIAKDNEFKLDYTKLFLKKECIQVKKSNEFLRWRFSENPINNYENYVLINDKEVLAYCVLKFYNKNEIDIVEVNSIDSMSLKVLINNILAMNKDIIEKVNTWMSIESDNHSMYEKLGFVNKMPITYFGARILNNCKQDILYNFKNWYIQMGDSDVY